MDMPAFWSKRFVRPALITIALYISIIAILLMAMIKPAHASGTVTPQRTYCVAFFFLGGASYYACSSSYSAACSTLVGGTTFSVGCGNYCVTNTGTCSWPAYVSSQNHSAKPSCPDNSTGTPATNPASCTCDAGYEPDTVGISCALPGCPANMSGSPCTCNAGTVPNPNGAGCVAEQFILSEPQDQAQLPDVEPGSSGAVTARVVSALTGLPKEGAVVRLHLEVDLTSGGHDHGESFARRPRGSISGDNCVPEPGGTPDTFDCTTGADGKAGFTFNAPDASGTHTITVTCFSSFCSSSKTVKIDVKVDKLTSLTESPEYELIGSVQGMHTVNHYLTSAAKINLMRIVKEYNATYLTSRLYLNDASLEWGGVFDICSGRETALGCIPYCLLKANGSYTCSWSQPHAEHRRGVVIDIRANSAVGAIPVVIFPAFEQLAKDTAGAVAELHGSGTNRHFHVRLLGNKFRF